MQDIDLDTLQTIMGLMTKYQIDSVEINGLKLMKSQHNFVEPQPKHQQNDDALLYYSSDQ
jgi:succinyl-CoA synthetase beta subunit